MITISTLGTGVGDFVKARSLYIFTHVYVGMYVFVSVWMCRHMEAKGQCLVSSLIVPLLSLEFVDLPKFTDLQAPGIILSQPPQHEVYRHEVLPNF